MTRSNVTQRLALAVKAATRTTPSLAKRSISPHTLRHTTAMHLLQSGVDISVIALWGVHLISVQEVTVRAYPDREDWRGVYFDGARKCLSRLGFLLVL